jgi:hypothetical protein
MRVMRTSLWAALAATPLAVAGCECDAVTDVQPDLLDAARERRDAGPRPDTDERLDAAVEQDVGPVDVFFPEGWDGGPPGSLDCVHAHRMGEDLFRLSVDGNKDVPSFASVASGAGELVAVYSSSDFVPGSGLRNLEVFRLRSSGADPVVPPALIPGTEGASLPTLVAGDDGYWLSYVQGGSILVARFDASFAPVGAPSTVVSASPSVPPQLVRTSTGGYVAWVSGVEIRGRPLDANGAPSGAERLLLMGSSAFQQASLERVGAEDALALAWADGGRPRVARLDPSTGTLGPASDLSGDPGIFTSLDMAGISSAGDMGEVPLAGAAVYDLNDLGFRDVVFRVVSESGSSSLPVATVAAGGDQAWGATVAPYLSGYAVAYRAMVAGLPRPVLRVGYLDREGCRVGAVSDRYVVGALGSATGAPAELGVEGGTMLIVWSEERDTYFEYWAATLTCTERS